MTAKSPASPSSNPDVPTPAPLPDLSNPFTGLAAFGIVSQLAAMAAARWLPASLRSNAVIFALQLWEWLLGPGIILIGHYLQNFRARAIIRQLKGRPPLQAWVKKNTASPFRCFTPLLLAGLLAGSCLSLGGCASATPSTQQQLIASYQQNLSLAVTVIDTFLTIDADNSDYMAANLPALHQLANQLRVSVPPVVSAAESALTLYTDVQTPQNAATVESEVEAVGNLAAQARIALSQSQVTGLKRKGQ